METEYYKMCERLDAIFTVADDLMSGGHFEILNDLFVAISYLGDLEERLRWLCASLPAKDKLPNRVKFYELTEELVKQNEMSERVLKGLK